ncbi:20S proteasome subunit beta 7 [Nematocida minor]|uniref:20S proteasome subunit beta 7 n=1 Tax=Nematocida minor TaxID=1912983 RepID=UPI00221EEFF6|nr:20S proteasome subunit beta 7 [Nematocida minor]KAI5189637.1 20S proteasome subunit beta 7 [Nematocida minor]
MRVKGQEMRPYMFAEEPIQVHAKSYVMGTTVLAIKYKDGIMVASDTQLSYGSYCKYKNIERVGVVSKNTFLGSSGEYSNFQEMLKMLRIKMNPPGDKEPYLGPRECFEIVKNHMYKKRCEGIPELNTHVIAGMEDAPKSETLPYEYDPSGKFLGVVDHLGNFYYDSIVGTGIGAYLAVPILRAKIGSNTDLPEEEAHKILTDAMSTLFYRDTRASDTIQVSKITKNEITVSKPFTLKTSWEIANIL